MLNHFTAASFEQAVAGDKPVLVDFFATWCGPCRMIAPSVEELAAEYEGRAVVGKVDVDQEPGLAQRFGVMSIPTLVVLKGGKGTYADLSGDNGANYNVIVEHCTFGKVHACLTLGSESLHDYNIIMRDCHAKAADRVLWLKMRPDTPQQYEKESVENMTGRCGSFLVVRPWTQFFNPVERADMPASY